jgi:heme-degrading monooxygenase HmoA
MERHCKETKMIFEMAQIEIKPGMESAFEHGVAQATPLFQRARGCHGLQLLKSIEQPSRYTLMVTWETLEDHTVHFRESQDFQEWRRLVGGFFAGPPQVGYVQVAVAGF